MTQTLSATSVTVLGQHALSASLLVEVWGDVADVGVPRPPWSRPRETPPPPPPFPGSKLVRGAERESGETDWTPTPRLYSSYLFRWSGKVLSFSSTLLFGKPSLLFLLLRVRRRGRERQNLHRPSPSRCDDEDHMAETRRHPWSRTEGLRIRSPSPLRGTRGTRVSGRQRTR